MTRIRAQVTLRSLLDTEHRIVCDAGVDTDMLFMVLPQAWRERLGNLCMARSVEYRSVGGRVVAGDVYGPVEITIEGFRPVCSEVLFLDPSRSEGADEPMIGSLVLTQSRAAVDEQGQKLKHVKYVDLRSPLHLRMGRRPSR